MMEEGLEGFHDGPLFPFLAGHHRSPTLHAGSNAAKPAACDRRPRAEHSEITFSMLCHGSCPNRPTIPEKIGYGPTGSDWQERGCGLR